MCSKFFGAGTEYRDLRALGWQAANRRRLLTSTVFPFSPITGQGKIGLPAGHGQPDIGKNLGVEQGAVQLTPGVVHAVALAQCIEAVALAWMALTRHQQGVENAAVVAQLGTFTLSRSEERRVGREGKGQWA